jgi:hypothetical protein
MNCTKLIQEVSNYLDGDIDTSLRQELETHIGLCPDCKVIIDTTHKTIQIYRGCEPYPIPEALHSRLESALRTICQEPADENS